MDKLGVDTQVVFPTLFLIYITDDAVLDIALARAYNRFIAQACAKSGGRMRWVVVPPLHSVEESVKEIKWGKDNGAVGVFFRGIEGQRTLDNAYFNPIYQAASDADLPILIHTGAGCPLFLGLFDVERNHTFGHSRVQPLFAFRDLIANKIPEQFPKLRFGFIEASAGWVPFMLHILKRLFREKWKFSSDKDMFREYRIFVAAEADEDVSYIANYTGEDHLIIGSDYGHQDPSEERQLVAAMRAREDIPRALTDKMFFDNPKLLYPLN
jgi:predicted TIM-barrel fold metal-dependent hydrolase